MARCLVQQTVGPGRFCTDSNDKGSTENCPDNKTNLESKNSKGLSSNLPDADPTFRFLSLPPEIRNEIYKYLVGTPTIPRHHWHAQRTPIMYSFTDFRSVFLCAETHIAIQQKAYNYELAILRTNRQIYEESVWQFYRDNVFIKVTTNSCQFLRVFEQCAMMMMRNPLPSKISQWAISIDLMWADDRRHHLFNVIIPRVEIIVLTTVLYKASLCQKGVFDAMTLNITVSDDFNLSFHDIRDILLEPVRALYNVKNVHISATVLSIETRQEIARVVQRPHFDMNGLLYRMRFFLNSCRQTFIEKGPRYAAIVATTYLGDLKSGLSTHADQLRHWPYLRCESDFLLVNIALWLMHCCIEDRQIARATELIERQLGHWAVHPPRGSMIYCMAMLHCYRARIYIFHQHAHPPAVESIEAALSLCNYLSPVALNLLLETIRDLVAEMPLVLVRHLHQYL